MWPIAPVEEFSLATRLDYAAKAGATTITVRAPVLNWSGRNIRLRSRDGSTTETRTVSSVDGRKVTLSVALTNAYAANSIVQMLVDYTDESYYQEVEFVPIEFAYNITDATEIVRGNPSVDQDRSFGFELPDSKACIATAKTRIRPGYQDSLVVKAVIFPGAAGDVYHRIKCFWGAATEDWQASSVTFDFAAEAVTGVVSEKPKVFTGLDVAAGDYLTMEYRRDANEVADTVAGPVFVGGFLVYYNILISTPAPDVA